MVERYHLKILSSINEQGTLAGAAKQLCVTQSALSQAVKKLEDLMGVQFWEKSGRNIRLTESGKYLLGVAQRILPQLEHTDNVLKKFSEGTQGSLRIGMECHPCYKWLLQFIGPYLKSWPQVDVDIRKQFTFKGLAALYQYEIDILVTPDPVHRAGVVFHRVFDYEQVLVVPKSHELCQKDWVEPKDLMNEVVITYPVDKERLNLFQNFLIPAQVLPKKHVHIEDTDILLQMVASGRGVASLPRWLVEESSDQFGIEAVQLGPQGIQQCIYLGIREQDSIPEYFQAFLDLAEQYSG